MSTTNKYNEDNIRLAAYYNWKNAGCPNGKDEYFWNQAINQLYGSCKGSSCGCGSSKKTTKKVSTSKSVKSTKSASAKASTSTTNKITTSSK
jgi:hypothetical protein